MRVKAVQEGLGEIFLIGRSLIKMRQAIFLSGAINRKYNGVVAVNCVRIISDKIQAGLAGLSQLAFGSGWLPSKY